MLLTWQFNDDLKNDGDNDEMIVQNGICLLVMENIIGPFMFIIKE